MFEKWLPNLVFLFFIFTFKLISLDPPSQLIILDIDEGKNEIAKNDSLLFLHYRGWVFDKKKKVTNFCDAKGKMFDSTLDEGFRKNPGTNESLFSFRLGKKMVIPGWEIGIKDMKVGGKRCLVIPPKLAYGNRNVGSIIKANSTLIFEVELISINNL
tara:strand:- start:27 stop:497 length:471 start_codon:yes stop_codon:yes gene_type:complete